MPNYRGNEKQDLMIPVCLDDQLVPGTIEHTIDWIVDRESIHQCSMQPITTITAAGRPMIRRHW